MTDNVRNQCIALSALVQSLVIMNKLARTGQFSSDEAQFLFQAVLAIDTESVTQTYPVNQLNVGSDILAKLLLGETRSPITTYALTVMVLADKLMKQGPDSAFAKALQQSIQDIDNWSMSDTTLEARLAGLYQTHISPLTPKVVVHGQANFLKPNINTNRVRALLLAATRAAVMWRQCGGSRWQLLLNRKQLGQVSRTLSQ